MKPRESPEIVVAIDTREQKPYRFARSEVKTLASGDYSIVGLEDRIAIERKTKEDAYSSLGQGRARFERELQRLSRFDYAGRVDFDDEEEADEPLVRTAAQRTETTREMQP